MNRPLTPEEMAAISASVANGTTYAPKQPVQPVAQPAAIFGAPGQQPIQPKPMPSMWDNILGLNFDGIARQARDYWNTLQGNPFANPAGHRQAQEQQKRK